MGTSNDNYIRKILNDLQRMDYIRPEDVPNIDLYMDQVTTFMDEHLKYSKRYEEDKLLTKTMINNYTKNNLIPPPDKKKYSKEHMLMLVFIYYLKSFLSISDIQSILNPLSERYFSNAGEIKLEELYQEIFNLEFEQIDSTAKDIIRKLRKSKKSFTQVEDEKEKDFLNNFAFICLLSFDVYVKKQMIERLIDQIKEDEAEEEAKKKDSQKDKSKDSSDKKEAVKDTKKESKKN